MASPLGGISAPPATVRRQCSTCSHDIGVASNAWFKITNSYYLEAAEPRVDVDLKPHGDRVTVEKDSLILDGNIIQPLVCSCGERLAFRCVEATRGRTGLQNRVFHKLAKIQLKSVDSNALVPPTVRDTPADFAAPMPSVEARWAEWDHLAADSYERDENWGKAHSEWDRARARLEEADDRSRGIPKRALSPAAFGRHLMPLLEQRRIVKPIATPAKQMQPHSQFAAPLAEIAAKPARSTPVAHRAANSSSATPVANLPRRISPATPIAPAIARPPSAAPAGQMPAVNGHRPAAALAAESATDAVLRRLDALDAAFVRLQTDMRDEVSAMRHAIDNVFYEVRTRSSNAQSVDAKSLELLSETVANMSGRVGEIEGTKFTIELLKGKVKRLEERDVAGGPLSAAEIDAFAHSRPPSHHNTPGPTSYQPASTAVTAVHDSALKRKAETYIPPGEPPQKRSLGRPRKYESPGVQYGPVSNIASASPAGAHNNGAGAGYWHSFSSDPFNLAGRLVRRDSGGGGGGGAPMMVDGASPSSAAAVAAAAAASSPQQRPPHTRAKPVRNEYGVLIRRDGKPDRRSVTSAQNLQRMRDETLGSPPTGGASPSGPANGGPSPSTTAAPLAPMTPIAPAPSGPSSSSVRATTTTTTTPPTPVKIAPVTAGGLPRSNTPNTTAEAERRGQQQQQQQQQRQPPPPPLPPPDRQRGVATPEDPHRRIMGKMFPDGVAADKDRLNPASRLFAEAEGGGDGGGDRHHHSSPVRMRPRGEVVKEGMQEATHAHTQQATAAAAAAAATAASTMAPSHRVVTMGGKFQAANA